MSPVVFSFKKLFAMGAGLFVAGAAWATPQGTYEIRVPDRGRSCQAEAQTLAQNFARLTQLRVTSAECLSTVTLTENEQSYTLHRVALTYDSNTSFRPYTAYYGSGDFTQTPSNIVGVYDTYAGCLNEIPAQSHLFAQSTGLGVLAATCEPGTLGLDANYAMRIDGAGTPAQKLYAFSAGYPGENLSIFQGEIKGLLARSGAKLAELDNRNLLYYAPQPINLRLERVAVFREESYCTSQVNDAQAIYLSASNDWISTKCSAEDVGGETGRKIYTLNVLRIGYGLISSDFGLNSTRYLSFEECMQDRTRVLGALRSNGQSVYGGICRNDTGSDQFVLEVFRPL